MSRSSPLIPRFEVSLIEGHFPVDPERVDHPLLLERDQLAVGDEKQAAALQLPHALAGPTPGPGPSPARRPPPFPTPAAR